MPELPGGKQNPGVGNVERLNRVRLKGIRRDSKTAYSIVILSIEIGAAGGAVAAIGSAGQVPYMKSVVPSPLSGCIYPEVAIRIPGEMHDRGAHGGGHLRVQERFPNIPEVPPTATGTVDQFILGHDSY